MENSSALLYHLCATGCSWAGTRSIAYIHLWFCSKVTFQKCWDSSHPPVFLRTQKCLFSQCSAWAHLLLQLLLVRATSLSLFSLSPLSGCLFTPPPVCLYLIQLILPPRKAIPNLLPCILSDNAKSHMVGTWVLASLGSLFSATDLLPNLGLMLTISL